MADPAPQIVFKRRWRMNPNTWHQRLQLEVLKANWHNVALSDGDQVYFLNLPVVWDGNLKTGEMVLEPNPDATKKAERTATSQA